MSENKVLKPMHAFGLAIIVYFMFTVGDALGKWLQAGYHASQILLTINIVGFLIMTVAAIWTRGSRKAFQSGKWKLHAIRAGIMAVSTVFVLYALKKMPLADFYGVVFLNPIWVAILSRVFLKEKIPPSRWVAIFIGFMGVLVIAGAEFTTLNLGFFAALGASLLGAVAALLARHIGGHEPPTNFALSTHLGMIALNAVLLPGHFVMPALPDLGWMVLYGAMLTMAMMGITLVFARSHAVSQVAPLQYTQMVWGVLIGWAVFGNEPTLNVLAGSLLVTGAGLYILRSLRRGRLMTH